MAKITEKAHAQGAYVGFDLAHGVGNIELSYTIGTLILPVGALTSI